MANRPTKAAGNVFCQARLEASEYNDKLKSRAGAAEELGYSDQSVLARWELGTTTPPPEAVVMMADLYKKPELTNYYCVHMCPIGPECGVQEVKVEDLDRITIQALINLKKAESIQNQLLEIAEDGTINMDEKDEMNSILDTLTKLSNTTESLKIWIKKNL